MTIVLHHQRGRKWENIILKMKQVKTKTKQELHCPKKTDGLKLDYVCQFLDL